MFRKIGEFVRNIFWKVTICITTGQHNKRGYWYWQSNFDLFFSFRQPNFKKRKTLKVLNKLSLHVILTHSYLIVLKVMIMGSLFNETVINV